MLVGRDQSLDQAVSGKGGCQPYQSEMLEPESPSPVDRAQGNTTDSAWDTQHAPGDLSRAQRQLYRVNPRVSLERDDSSGARDGALHVNLDHVPAGYRLRAFPEKG